MALEIVHNKLQKSLCWLCDNEVSMNEILCITCLNILPEFICHECGEIKDGQDLHHCKIVDNDNSIESICCACILKANSESHLIQI